MICQLEGGYYRFGYAVLSKCDLLLRRSNSSCSTSNINWVTKPICLGHAPHEAQWKCQYTAENGKNHFCFSTHTHALWSRDSKPQMLLSCHALCCFWFLEADSCHRILHATATPLNAFQNLNIENVAF